MSVERTVSSSQGRPAEWHDQRTSTPKNAEKALAGENEHWIGDQASTDRDKFNAIFQPDVDRFNAKQTRPSRKMGPESTNPDRQKSYYDGIVDGTFCYGTGDQQETPIEEIVLQIGNKDDNGITDSGFDIEHWQKLKREGREDEAGTYALEHLSRDPDKERSKRILHRAVDRIAKLDPEHLIVIRADYHGDEPCGTGHVHIACILRATGYKQGMESRVASVRALEQMGFRKEKDKEFGIVQLHEKIKDVIAEEMAADALEYGYEPMTRKADSGEHRKRSDVDVYREMAKRDEDLMWEEMRLQFERENLDDLRAKQENTQKNQEEREAKLKRSSLQQRRITNLIYNFLHEMGDDRRSFRSFQEMYDAVVNAKKKFVEETRSRAQDDAAAEYQKKEDALEARRAALAEREAEVDAESRVLQQLEEIKAHLLRSADTDASRKRFMETHIADQAGHTLEDKYQESIRQKQEREAEIIRRASELADEYDNIHSHDDFEKGR